MDFRVTSALFSDPVQKNNRMAWYPLFVHVCEILANNTLLCYRLTGSLFFFEGAGL